MVHTGNSFFSRFFQSRWRYAVVLLTLAASLMSLRGMQQLRIVSDPSEMLQTPDPALDRLARDFNIQGSDVLVMIQSPDSVLQPSVLKALREIHVQVQQCAGVSDAWSLWSLRSSRRVRRYVLPVLSTSGLSPANFPDTRERVLAHPLATGHLLSDDGTATLILARTNEQIGDVPSVEDLQAEIESIVQTCLAKHAVPTGTEGVVTGFPVVHAEIHRLMQRDQYLFNLVGFAAGAALGWLLLRRLAAVICVAAGPLTGVCLTMGLAGYCDVPITIINSTMPLIILIVGYADAIHLVLAIREHMVAGEPIERAIPTALRHLWLPCLLTSITTAVGFGSLLISHVGTIRDFGGLTAVGCLINFVAVMVVVPIAASFFGRLLLRPATAATGEPFVRTSTALARGVQRWSRPLAVAGALSIVASLWCAGQLRTSNRLADSVPHDGTTYRTYQMCENKFHGTAEIHARLEWPADVALTHPEVTTSLLRIEQAMLAQPGLGTPMSLLDLVRSLPGGFDEQRIPPRAVRAIRQLPPAMVQRLVNEEQHATLVSVRVPDVGVDELRAIMERLQADVGPAHAAQGFDVAIVGQVATTVRNFQQLVIDLIWSLVLASLVIFGLMTVLFRSWRIGLLSTIPNVFALLGAAAMLYLTDTPVQLASLVCFTICLGISVDDTIHYLSRYRMLRRECEREQAAVEAIVRIGPALFITTVVFVVGFGTVLLSQIPVLRTFSWLACGCLLLAILGDMVLLPAVLITLARWNAPREQPGARWWKHHHLPSNARPPTTSATTSAPTSVPESMCD